MFNGKEIEKEEEEEILINIFIFNLQNAYESAVYGFCHS